MIPQPWRVYVKVISCPCLLLGYSCEHVPIRLPGWRRYGFVGVAYAAPTSPSGLQYGQEQVTLSTKSLTKSLTTIRTFTIRTLSICHVNIPLPLVTWSPGPPRTVEVTFSFTSTPPGVSDWGTLDCGSDGICRVNVQVTGPAPPDCLVGWMTHKDSQTYSVPDDACGFEVSVNGNYVTSVSFNTDCPNLQDPNEGGLWTDRTYYRLGETNRFPLLHPTSLRGEDVHPA